MPTSARLDAVTQDGHAVPYPALIFGESRLRPVRCPVRHGSDDDLHRVLGLPEPLDRASGDHRLLRCRPEILEPVKLSRSRLHDVNNHVHQVHQYPLGCLEPLDTQNR